MSKSERSSPSDKPLIEVRGDLKARDIANLELEALRTGQDYLIDGRSFSMRYVFLKAAIGCGWIASPECKKTENVVNGSRAAQYYFDGEPVDDMDPRDIMVAGGVIVDLFLEYTSLDPTKSNARQPREKAATT